MQSKIFEIALIVLIIGFFASSCSDKTDLYQSEFEIEKESSSLEIGTKPNFFYSDRGEKISFKIRKE